MSPQSDDNQQYSKETTPHSPVLTSELASKLLNLGITTNEQLAQYSEFELKKKGLEKRIVFSWKDMNEIKAFLQHDGL